MANHTPIKVIDSIMGSGKTSAAINLMNADTTNNYIFITPYLTEVERIKQSCSDRKFYEPKVYSNNGETFFKLDSLHNLLSNNSNIVTTHALFKTSTEETRELIGTGDYILILDEVMEVVKELNVSPHDVRMLLNEQWITNDNGKIIWNKEKENREGEYKGEFKTVRRLALNDSLILHKETMLMWEFPAEIFSYFKEVYVLTYLFNAQIQKYYYDINNIKYEKYKVEYINDEYTITKGIGSDKEFKSSIKDKINIYDGSLNVIGEDIHALSYTWYSDKRHLHKKMKNNILNYYQNIMKTKLEFNMWTTYKEFAGKLKGKGYTKGFVAHNVRSTNDYSHKTCLTYGINKFLNPIIDGYFRSHGTIINQELYSVSEFIQWIWRSAIRNDKEIYIYIPSKRMRDLFIQWLDNEI